MRLLFALLLVLCGTSEGRAQSALVAPTLEAVVTPPFFGSEPFRRFGSVVVMDGVHAAARGEIAPNGAGDGTVHVLRRIQGAWALSQHITIANGAAVRFGFALALHGNLLFVGAPGPYGEYALAPGAVYVYEFGGTEWTLADVIESPAPITPLSFNGFGEAVDFDGQRLIVGDPTLRGGPGQQSWGAAYVYERVGGEWALTASLASSYPDAYEFGRLVGVDGTHAVVTGAGGGRGRAHTFELAGGAWTETGDLSGSLNDYISSDATLSMDGGRVAVGLPRELVNGQRGAVYVFERVGSSWTRSAKLTDVAEPGENGINFFGAALDLDGDRFIAGSPAVGNRALIFSFDGSVWIRVASLRAPPVPAGVALGTAVALDDGQALVGAPRAEVVGAPSAGAVFGFDLGPTGWTPGTEVNLGPQRPEHRFGTAIALSGDHVAVCAQGQVETFPYSYPSVYVFAVAGGVPIMETRITIPCGAVALGTDHLMVSADGVSVYTRGASGWTFSQRLYESGLFGTSISLDGDRALIGAPGYGTSPGRAYLYERAGATWRLSHTFRPRVPEDSVSFGMSVALDGARAVVGAPGTASSGGAVGIAYVYERDGAAWDRVAVLTSPTPDTDGVFGASVALSGGRALVGARSGPSGDGGSATVFDGIAWTQAATLPSPGAGNSFGSGVALDGGRALVGARIDADSLGRAFLYGYDGIRWTLTAALESPNPGDGEEYGASVAVEGRRFAVGAPYPRSFSSEFGAVYLYRDQAAVVDEAAPLAGTARLQAPHPNPASGTSRLVLMLTQPERVTATVFDALGRSVQTVLNGEPVGGEVTLSVDASRLAPGLYVVRVVGDTFAESARLVVVH